MKCHPWALDPVGAWSAISMQRSKTSGSTARDRSSRLRTTRVVVSRWSTVARSIGHDYHPTFMIGNEGGEGRGAHHLAATANGQSRSREPRAPETCGSGSTERAVRGAEESRMDVA